ncbi:MAG: SRPBCC family protein [Rhodothermales bacterium]
MNTPNINPVDLEIAPLATSETIPSAWYTDPAFHAFDLAAVLARSWQYVGPASDVAEPGSYVTDFVAGNPVLVARDRTGALSAFYNVCKHRGGPLATDRCGRAQMLRCQYHGWTYRMDGMLRGVPRFDRTELFDKKNYGLTPIGVEIWEGLLFVCLEPENATPIAELFAGIPEHIAPIRLTDPAFRVRDSYDVACNWKVYVDNYLEGYHIPLVHPELCELLDYRSYETETFTHYSLQHSPIKNASTAYGPADGAAYYYFVFPNLMLNILPGRLQVNRVDALAPDRCRTLFDYYATAEHNIDEDRAFSDRVQQEDIHICEHVQRGLASRAYDRGRFSYDLENGVHHFQSMLKTAYRAATTCA